MGDKVTRIGHPIPTESQCAVNYPLQYLEHFSDRDIELLALADRSSKSALRAHILESPELIDELLAARSLYETVIDPSRPEVDPGVSSFLAFGVMVGRLATDLQTASFIPEWSGPGRRLPVFDVEPLREFFEDGERRFFLIEFLNSFTTVASGTLAVRTKKGIRYRRFSELDPVILAEMVEQLPQVERPGGYRRLGDVTLFLCGVFPDYTASHPFDESQREWLARSACIAPGDGDDGEDFEFLESAGAAWYRRAVDAAVATAGAGPEFLRNVADRFSQARRILNCFADRFLFQTGLGEVRPSG